MNTELLSAAAMTHTVNSLPASASRMLITLLMKSTVSVLVLRRREGRTPISGSLVAFPGRAALVMVTTQRQGDAARKGNGSCSDGDS